MKKGTNLSKKLDEYKAKYAQKEKEWDEIIANLEAEKEEEIRKAKESFEEKKKKQSLLSIDKKLTPSKRLQELRATNQKQAAMQQETQELGHHNFAVIREEEERMKLLDKQCQTKINQIIAVDDEYISKQKKKKERELAKIDKEYENLKLYIARLNRHF